MLFDTNFVDHWMLAQCDQPGRSRLALNSIPKRHEYKERRRPYVFIWIASALADVLGTGKQS